MQNSFDPLSRMTRMIERNGFGVQFVFPDTEQGLPSFAYTVGLHTATGYELALSGLDPHQTQHVLLPAVARLRDANQPPSDGMDLDHVLAGGLLLRLRRAEQPDRFVTLDSFYDDIPPVWQAMWPDPQGRFPGDPDCSLSPAAQLLL